MTFQAPYLGVKECTDRLVVAEFESGMTAVDKLVDVGPAPQNAVTPRRNAALLTENTQIVFLCFFQKGIFEKVFDAATKRSLT